MHRQIPDEKPRLGEDRARPWTGRVNPSLNPKLRFFPQTLQS